MPDSRTFINQGQRGEVNNIPPKSSYNGILPLHENKGPAIWMEKADHRKTASWGNSKKARVYRETQKELISQNKFREALKMDINDIRSKFGNKYEQAIKQALKYVDKIEKNCKTKPDELQTKDVGSQHELERSKNLIDKLKLAKQLRNNDLKQQEAKNKHESETISKANSQKLKELSPKSKEAHHEKKDIDIGRNRQLAQQIGEPSPSHFAKSSEIRSQSKEISHPDKNKSEKGESSSTRSPQPKEPGKNINEGKNQKLAHQMKDSSVTHSQKYTEAKSAPKENTTNQRQNI